MLELNQSNCEEVLIKDVNEDTFMDDVIEASKSSPIVVDFFMSADEAVEYGLADQVMHNRG